MQAHTQLSLKLITTNMSVQIHFCIDAKGMGVVIGFGTQAESQQQPMHIIQPITQALPIATVHACNHHCLS
jgi:hypothetical protein